MRYDGGDLQVKPLGPVIFFRTVLNAEKLDMFLMWIGGATGLAL